MRTIISLAALAALCLGCAGTAPGPAPGTSQVSGALRLVPYTGNAKASGGGSAYGDRRLRDVRLVDYSHPGFAVVYVEADAAPAGDLALTIRSAPVVGVVVEPSEAAIGASGRVIVRNRTDVAHVVSHPAAGKVLTVGPGEEGALAIPHAGEQRLYLLDVPTASATVFAAPGPFTVVSESGEFTLRDLAPGHHTLHAWHPRLPPAVRTVDLPTDSTLRVDLELGVGASKESGDAN